MLRRLFRQCNIIHLYHNILRKIMFQLKVQFVRFGQNFSLKHSKSELTLSTECEETPVLMLNTTMYCFAEMSTEVSMLTS